MAWPSMAKLDPVSTSFDSYFIQEVQISLLIVYIQFMMAYIRPCRLLFNILSASAKFS